VTIAVHPAASVDIQVTVSHTAPDGSGATTIVQSAQTTIDASTSDPYALSIGSGALQTFTSASPRRLRVLVNVVSVTSGGDFTLDYDGTCGSSLCSNLDTPVVVVPELGLAFLPAALLLPLLGGQLARRRRLAAAAVCSVGGSSSALQQRTPVSNPLRIAKREMAPVRHPLLTTRHSSCNSAWREGA
jgi:hypothetical protein